LIANPKKQRLFLHHGATNHYKDIAFSKASELKGKLPQIKTSLVQPRWSLTSWVDHNFNY
jgi:hypothetical protein